MCLEKAEKNTVKLVSRTLTSVVIACCKKLAAHLGKVHKPIDVVFQVR